MVKIATLLSVTVAAITLSNCVNLPNVNYFGDDKDAQYLADTERTHFTCRSYNYDPRSCR